MMNPKRTPATDPAVDPTPVIHALQQNLQSTDARVQRVEEASKVVAWNQVKLEEKLDGI
jgi:hypothetical protein